MTTAAVFLAAAQLFAPGTYKVVNYQNLTTVAEREFRGAPCLYVSGPAEEKDTAFRMTSARIPLEADAKTFRLKFKAYAERRMYGTTGQGEGWNNAIHFYDAGGKKVSSLGLGFSIPRGDFSEIALAGPVPSGAASAAVQIGFDSPNLTTNVVAAYRDFTFDTLKEAKADKLVVRVKPVPLPSANPVRPKVIPVDRMPDTPAVTLRDDGMTLIGGEPFFPIGIYSVCKREFNGMDFDVAFRELKEAGFNFAHTYGNPWEQAFLDGARKYGFKLWVGTRWPGKELVEKGRFNPDIIAWYTGDDTSEHETPEESRAYHDTLKAIDPTRLTCQADNVCAAFDSSRYTDFVNSTDVFMPELYGIRGKAGDVTDTNCVAWCIKEMKGIWRDIKTCANGQPKGVWPILQSFKGWGGWGHYPTRQQIYATTFATVIHGAHGVTWYTYGGFYSKKKGSRNEGITSSPERFADMAELATWLKELSPALLERTGVQPPPAEILAGPAKDCFDNDSVSCLLKRHGNETYLLTVNSTFEKVRARFRLANVPATAEVMRENRKATVSAGLLEDDFEPFAVHVYRFN